MAKLTVILVTLIAPMTAWSHAGHAEFFKITDHTHFQLYEAMLVAALLVFIALSKPVEGILKKVKSRLTRTHNRH